MTIRFSRLRLSVVLIAVLALPTVTITPFAHAQEDSPPVRVQLIPYEGAPILTADKTLAWEAGGVGLADQSPGPRRFWNRIPEAVREQAVECALERPDQSPRHLLAWGFTDTQGYFISEVSVYRILRGYDLITSPAFDPVKAGDRFDNPHPARQRAVANGFHAVQSDQLGAVQLVYDLG